MSRILIVTEQLNSPIIAAHIESIKNLQHEIIIVTSQNQKDFELESHGLQNVQVLFFFRRWSLTEWIRFIPALVSTRPQLIHFLIETERNLTAQKLLLETCQSFGIPVFTHFLNLTYINPKSKNLTYFVYKSDLITCAHRQSLLDLRGLSTFNRKQIRGLIPPVLRMRIEKNAADESHWGDNIATFLKKNSKAFIVPFKSELLNLDTHYWKVLTKILEYHSVLFIGDLDALDLASKKKAEAELTKIIQKNKTQWLYHHTKNFARNLCLAPKNSVVFLAGLPLTIQEISEAFEQAILAEHLLIIDEFQAELYSGLWQNKHNAIILSNYQLIKELDHLLRFQEWNEFNFHALNSAQIRSEIMDAPINEFNRLLNKVLSTSYEKR